MKRIKQIIEAMKTLGMSPKHSIEEAMGNVLGDARTNEQRESSQDERELIERLLSAIVTFAEDMEKPAKGDEKA